MTSAPSGLRPRPVFPSRAGAFRFHHELLWYDPLYGALPERGPEDEEA